MLAGKGFQAVPRALASLAPAAWVLPSPRVVHAAAAGSSGSNRQLKETSNPQLASPNVWQRTGALLPLAGAAQALQRIYPAGIMCTGIGASNPSQGVRSVGSVHRGKIVGNVVEAWERRAVEEVMGTRDPANFDDFQSGDSVAVRLVNVWAPQKLSTFAGVCIARHNGLLGASFILRNHIDGCAIEQQFALYSPLLRGIRKLKEPVKRKRRSKLYYLRDRPPRESTVVFSEKDLNLPKEP